MYSIGDEDIDEIGDTGNANIDAMLFASQKWSLYAQSVFSFSIPNSEEDYEDTRAFLVDDYPSDVHEDIRPMPDAAVAAVLRTAAEFEKIVTFSFKNDPNDQETARVRFGYTDFGKEDFEGVTPNTPAYGNEPDADSATSVPTQRSNWMSGDIFLNDNFYSGSAATLQVGSFACAHLLNATASAFGIFGNPYSTNAASRDVSVKALYPDFGSGVSIKAGHYAQSLMFFDIAALQAMYGADYGTEAGATTYKWDASDGSYFINGAKQWTPAANVVFMTIWDGGGVDTYDLTDYAKGVSADLAPGGVVNFGIQRSERIDASGDTVERARGNVFNAGLYQNNTSSLIENLKTGRGDDILRGNAAGNQLEGGAGDDLMQGRQGDDTLIGGGGADTMDGGEGEDLAAYVSPTGATITIQQVGAAALGAWSVTGLVEGAGDTLAGIEAFRFGEGSDSVTGIGASDFNLDGRGGNDTLSTGAGDDTLMGGDGTDVLRTGAGVFQVFGGRSVRAPEGGVLWVENAADNDQIVVNRSSDSDGYTLDFFAGLGSAGEFRGSDDSRARGVARLDFTGGDGDDRVFAGFGTARLSGGGGADQLYGRDKNDTIYGGDGTDFLRGGAGNDAIYTGAGDEGIVYGESGNDTLIGGDGRQFFDGGVDADSIFGGGGVDNITGGDGADTLKGGAGADTIYTGLGADSVDGGADFDVLQVNRSGTTRGVSYFLNAAAGSDGSISAGIETLVYFGGEANDTVRGGAGGDQISGNGGRDVLEGGVGDGVDTLLGGEGNDTLRGGGGADGLYGGGGNDRIEAGLGDDAVVRGDGGNDTIIGGDGNQFFSGGDGNDRIEGLDGNDYLEAGIGNDTLLGGVGDDRLITSLGVESVDGGAGVDVLTMNRSGTTRGVSFFLNGAEGSDGSTSVGIEFLEYRGGEGFDTVRGAAGGDEFFGNGGNDLLDGGAGAASDRLFGGGGDDTLRGGAGKDGLYGGEGSDRIETGAGGDAAVFGENGNDTLVGSGDGEVLSGGEGRDSLIGGAGNDNLNGGATADTLLGGLGADDMTGGGSSDRFVFERGAGADVIRDFDAELNGGQDQIHVAALGYRSFGAMLSAGVTIRQVGGDTVINFKAGNPVVTLAGIDDADITSADFTFLI